jgi:hypothetical protein
LVAVPEAEHPRARIVEGECGIEVEREAEGAEVEAGEKAEEEAEERAHGGGVARFGGGGERREQRQR